MSLPLTAILTHSNVITISTAPQSSIVCRETMYTCSFKLSRKQECVKERDIYIERERGREREKEREREREKESCGVSK